TARRFSDFHRQFREEQERAQETGLSADRIAKVVRMFSSEREAGNAALALYRMALEAGHDVFWLADVIAAAMVHKEKQPPRQDDGNVWMEVDSYTLTPHRKAGSRPSLCVEYRVRGATYRDWLALQHGEAARHFGHRKWADLGGEMPGPITVSEAIDRI